MFVDYLLYGRFVDDDIAYHITCIDLNIQSDTVKPYNFRFSFVSDDEKPIHSIGICYLILI